MQWYWLINYIGIFTNIRIYYTNLSGHDMPTFKKLVAKIMDSDIVKTTIQANGMREERLK